MVKGVDVKNSVGLSKSTKTLLIVVIAIMSIAVIFLVVKGLSNKNNTEIHVDKLTADLKISQVEIINNTDLNVKVDKGTVEGEIQAINFIFYNEDGKEIKRSKILINQLEENYFLVSFHIANTSKIKSISIIPIFVNKSNGGSVIGKVEDEYTIIGEENTNNKNNNQENTSNEENTSTEVLPECTLDTNCNDNNGCTSDLCVGGNCSHTLIENCIPCSISSQCEDSNVCTTNVCSEGKCSYLAIPGCAPCSSNLNCEDNNSCTNNLCIQGRCLYAYVSNCKVCTFYSDCEDNDPCTTNTCSNGVCTFPSVSNCKICTLTSQCEDNDSSTISSCTNGKCVYTKITSCKNNDLYCPSGCTAVNDNDCSYICGNGIREGIEKCDGTNLGGATCSGVLGVGFTGKLKCFSGLCTFDTSLCVAPCTCASEGNACTTDACVSGVCQHTPISGCCISNSQCGNGKVCTGNVCVTSSNPPSTSNPICEDGACNGTETCSSCTKDCGTCVSYLRTFYVSNSGLNTNNGTTPFSPWKTIAKVNSQTFLPGDAILFKRGDEWRELLTIGQSGSSSAYITYSAYGSGNIPIINGADIVTGWSNTGSNVWSVNAPTLNSYGLQYDYMVIMNGNMLTQVGTLGEVTSAGKFFIDKTPTPDKVYMYSTTNPASTVEVSARMFGAAVADKTYIKFENMDFRNTAHTGLYFFAATATGQVIGNSLVSHCNFYRNRNVGIMFDNGYSNSLVEYSTSTYNGNGFYSWSDQTYGSDDNVFNHCTSKHNIGYTVGVITDGHGFGIYNSDDNIVEYSESSYNYCGIQTDANGGANDVILRYNYIHDITNGAPGIGFGSNMPPGTIQQAYYNLIVNMGDLDVYSYPIAVGSITNASKVYIYNNVIYQDGGPNHGKFGVHLTTPNGVTLKNNIFYIRGTGYVYGIVSGAGTFNEIDNNIYYFPDASATRWYTNGSFYSTLSAWRVAVSDEENSITSNPLLTNPSAFDFSLQSGSPAINAGVSVGLTKDYAGNSIVGLPDIGAYESQ